MPFVVNWAESKPEPEAPESLFLQRCDAPKDFKPLSLNNFGIVASSVARYFMEIQTSLVGASRKASAWGEARCAAR